MSRMLQHMEGLVSTSSPSTLRVSHPRAPKLGSKQLLARKWWECGGSACDNPPAKAPVTIPTVGIHMGEQDKFRKKNCRTAECEYANSATGFNVPGTGVTGHRWDAMGELVQGAARANVGDRLTKYGGLGAPWAGFDEHNKDAAVVQERATGVHDIIGGANIDLNRGGPPRTEKTPLTYAFQGGLLGKGANEPLNHEDAVLVRHSTVGFPRWDAEGEALPQPPTHPKQPLVKEGQAKGELADYLDKALDYDASTPRSISPHQDDVGLFDQAPKSHEDWWDGDKVAGPKGGKQPLLHIHRATQPASVTRTRQATVVDRLMDMSSQKMQHVRIQRQHGDGGGMRVPIVSSHVSRTIGASSASARKGSRRRAILAGEEEEPSDGGKDAWGDEYNPKEEEEEKGAVEGKESEEGEEDEHEGKDVWGSVVRPDEDDDQDQDEEEEHDKTDDDLDEGEQEKKAEEAGGQVRVCDPGNPVGCKTKVVASYVDHSATAHGNGRQPPPARVVRVCSPSLGIGKKGCKLIPDFHRMAADEAAEMQQHVAQEHELPFLLLQLDVHADTEEHVIEYVGKLKRALARAIGLRFDTDVDHLVLAPALGPEPSDWIQIIKVANLNCTEPHECEDLGRRRRRLLSVDQDGSGSGRKLSGVSSWEKAIEHQASKLVSHSDTHSAKTAHAMEARTGAAKTRGTPPRPATTQSAEGQHESWTGLVKQAQQQQGEEQAEAQAKAKAQVSSEERALALQVEQEVVAQMRKADIARVAGESRIKELAVEAVKKERMQEAVLASKRQRAKLEAAERAKVERMDALRKAVAREQKKTAMLEEEEKQEEEATLVQVKIYVSKQDDLANVRTAVIDAIESGAIDTQLAKADVEGPGPVPLKVGVWRSIEGYAGDGECVLDCHQVHPLSRSLASLSFCACVCIRRESVYVGSNP